MFMFRFFRYSVQNTETELLTYVYTHDVCATLLEWTPGKETHQTLEECTVSAIPLSNNEHVSEHIILLKPAAHHDVTSFDITASIVQYSTVQQAVLSLYCLALVRSVVCSVEVLTKIVLASRSIASSRA